MLQRLVHTLAAAVLAFGAAHAQDSPSTAEGLGLSDADAKRLQQVLDAQPEESQARYQWRHPAETLAFFGIEPGMTVVEVLPGGGWYSAILIPYLGSQGVLIGADYPLGLWPNFPFATDEFMAGRRSWPQDWPATAAQWRDGDGAEVLAMRIGGIPDDLNGSADAVLFIRALHNLNAFEGKGGFRSAALADAWAVLKPGGVVGVVQHSVPKGRLTSLREDTWSALKPGAVKIVQDRLTPEGRSDQRADGSRGYLDKDAVVADFQAIGFELVGESDVNRNPKDMLAEDEVVWRLPPTLDGSEDDPELRAKYQAIGESNRMTLLFRKPAA